MNLSMDISEWSNGTTLASAVAPASGGGPCSSGIDLARYVIEVWLVIPIALFGIVGNILAFIVLFKQKQNITTTIILQSLAVIDTLYLVAIIPLRSLWIAFVCTGVPVDYKEPWKVIFRIVFPIVFSLRLIETWLITFLTLDRWIAVCFPLHASRLCTKQLTIIRLIVLIVCATIFSAPRFFESSQYGFFDHTSDVEVLNDNKLYVILYQVVLFFIFMYLVPMLMLVILNVQLIGALWRASSSLAGRRHSRQGSPSLAQHRGITVIVITVVTTCVICNVMAICSHLLYSLEKFTDDDSFKESLELRRRPITLVNNLFLAINSAINFALYCLSSKSFRQATWRTLCCCCSYVRVYSPVPQSLNSTSHTYDTYVPTARTSNGGSSQTNGSNGEKIKMKRIFKARQK